VPAPFWGDAAPSDGPNGPPSGPSDAPAGRETDEYADDHRGDDEDADAGLEDQPDGAIDGEIDGEIEVENEVESRIDAGDRFEELVAERLHHARYAHPLTRAVFTPTESLLIDLVERRAAVWVPTMTFLVTAVSAIAAVVLATRLRADPTDPSGGQLLLVTVVVCLVAAAFVTLVRAEMHYQRIRPRGRVVRHDVADAYEVVRDAPRRLLEQGASHDVLRRVADLLPVAEQLVDVLAAYQAQGGPRVKAHPAYEQVTRMRAEVEALELIVEEKAAQARAEARAEADVEADVEADAEPVAGQTPSFAGLADIAATLTAQP
jgi:hypothetical protein